MNLRPLVVTGPIGSGKSTVSKLLEGFGANRVDLDELGKEVLLTPEGVRFVSLHWPDVVSDRGVDRTRLAAHVFEDQRQLHQLEEFVHPRVDEAFQARFGSSPLLAVEVSVPSAISIKGQTRLIIDTPIGARRERLMRRGMSKGDIEARISSQPTDAVWLASADLVISNRWAESDLDEDVEALWTWWIGCRERATFSGE